MVYKIVVRQTVSFIAKQKPDVITYSKSFVFFSKSPFTGQYSVALILSLVHFLSSVCFIHNWPFTKKEIYKYPNEEWKDKLNLDDYIFLCLLIRWFFLTKKNYNGSLEKEIKILKESFDIFVPVWTFSVKQRWRGLSSLYSSLASSHLHDPTLITEHLERT